VVRPTAADRAFAVLAVTIALGVKAFYSRADTSALTFVLGPSCWLAAHLGGVELVAEEGAGFISHGDRMVVGPACAGVNFLVVAFLAVVLSRRAVGIRGKLAGLLIAAVAAYSATILTNGLRIVLAAHLFRFGQIGWLTPERLHRLAGVAIYCLSLLTLCRALAPERRSALIPLGCYLGVVIGIPFLDGAARRPRLFLEHVLVVVVVCILAFGLAYGLWNGASRKSAGVVDRV
jgi:exosortase K